MSKKDQIAKEMPCILIYYYVPENRQCYYIQKGNEVQPHIYMYSTKLTEAKNRGIVTSLLLLTTSSSKRARKILKTFFLAKIALAFKSVSIH